MEETRDKLNKLIAEKGLLNEITILVSQQLDKFIVSHYKDNIEKELTTIRYRGLLLSSK